MRTNLFRRLHRKIVLIDGVLAFVGGINFSADHLIDYGPTAKQDYAISVRGPLVDEIARFEAEVLNPVRPTFSWRALRKNGPVPVPAPGESTAALVGRYNDRHKDQIGVHLHTGFGATTQT